MVGMGVLGAGGTAGEGLCGQENGGMDGAALQDAHSRALGSRRSLSSSTAPSLAACWGEPW